MQRYSVFKRTIGKKRGANGKIKKSVKFYFQVKDMDTGVYGPALSVEAMRKRLGEARLGDVTNMPEARSVVEKAIERGLVSYDGRKVEEVFLVPYLLNFWDFDNSDYIQMANRLSKNGNAISRYTAKRNMQNLLLHVLPGDKNTGWSIPEDSTASVFYPLLLSYITMMLNLAVFSRSPSLAYRFNFKPFCYLESSSRNAFYYDILNYLFFIPFGFMVEMLQKKRRGWLTFLIGVLFSFGIEAVQLLLKFGLAEFDDLFENAVGTLLGVLLCHLVLSISRRITAFDKEEGF